MWVSPLVDDAIQLTNSDMAVLDIMNLLILWSNKVYYCWLIDVIII